MGEWKEFKLKEITSKIGSGATPRGGENSYCSEGIALIRSQNVNDFHFSMDGLAFINQDQAEELKNVEVQENDVLINITGESVTRSCVVPRGILPARVNQHVSIIRPVKQSADYRYIFYFLQSIKSELNSMAEIGCTRRALTKGMLEDLDILLPSLSEQRNIADVLSSLDDKIDLLHRQNKTLESLAQTLFRQWFVEGAGVTSEKQVLMGDFIESVSVTHTFSNPQVIFLNTSDIYMGEVLRHEYEDVCRLPGQAKKTIRKGDILFSEIRPANGRYAYIDFEANDYVVSTKLMVLRSNGKISPAFVFFFLSNPQVVDWLQMLAEARSGTFPQITFDEIRDLKINVPSEEFLLTSAHLCEEWLRKIRSNHTQTQILKNLRDVLLPKLMSGEVRVTK